MKINSIKTRLLLLLLPFVLVSFIVLSGTGYYLAQQALGQSVDEAAEAISSDYGHRIAGHIEGARLQLESFAGIRRIYNPVDMNTLKEALADCAKHLVALENVTYISPTGAAMRPDGSTLNLADRAYFKKVVSTLKPTVSDVQMNRSTGKAGINVAVPVLVDGRMTGVLTGSVSMDKLREAVKAAKFQTTGYAAVLDSAGLVVVHPRLPEMEGKLNLGQKKINPELKLQQAELDDRLVKMVTEVASNGKTVRGKYKFVDGVDRIGTFTSIAMVGGQRWIMFVTAPEAEAMHAVTELMKAMLVLSIICLIVAVLFIMVISKRIAGPIQVIRDECLLLAQGDLRQQGSKVSSHDEIGQLANGFSEMRHKLNVMVTSINGAADRVSANAGALAEGAEQTGATAGQVSSTILHIAEGTSQQTGQAEQIREKAAATKAEVRSGLEEADSTLALASQTSQVATEGTKSLQQAIEQLGNVRSTVRFATESIQNLGRRSDEIGSIVGVITGIAGQTNLLALNAAIEAARAGEHGRGFGVVAEEVRKLAEESAEAATKIGNLIRDIQVETSVTVRTMESNLKQVDVQVDAIEAGGSSMGEVARSIGLTEHKIVSLRSRLQTLNAHSDVMLTAVGEMVRVVQGTAAAAEEVAASSEEQSAATEEMAELSKTVAEVAEELKKLIHQFRV